MAVCALFCYQLNHFLPTLSQALRYVGAGYILWLAVHVARSKPAGGSGTMVVQPPADLGGHRRVYDLGRGGGGLFQAFLTKHYRPLQLRHGAVLAPSVPWAWWSEGPGEHRDFPKISPKPDGRGLPGLLQWGWKHHPL